MFDYSKALTDGEVLNGNRLTGLFAAQDVFANTTAPIPFANTNLQIPDPDVVDVPPLSRVLDYSWRPALQRLVADWMSLFVEEGQVVELRALRVVQEVSNAKLTWSGFYTADKLDRMAYDALELTADAEGVYFSLNPLEPSLLALRSNRCEPAKDTAKDADVLQRRWLLIDADPVRRAGISSTDEEKLQAWLSIREVHRWLQEQGWPEPILADSGNGYHLLYRIDLPGDDGGLVKGVLGALAKRFDNARVKIDTNVFNPGRIVKLYGTVARKGDSLRERPHRRTGVLSIPQNQEVVSRELLVKIGGEVPGAVKAEAVQKPANVEQPNTLSAGMRADLVQSARNYLAKVPGAISGQGGSNQTFKAACKLARFGLTDEEAMPLFREWNQKCEPPWEEKDLQKKLRDARIKVGPARMTRQLDGTPAIGINEAADDPHRLAEIYLSKGRVDGVNTLLHWNGDWYRWDGVAYTAVADSEIKAELTRTIKAEFDQINRVERLRPVTDEQTEPARTPRVRKVTTALLTNTMQALKSQCFVTGKNSPPCWLDDEDRVPANEALVAQNGWVHVPSLIDGKGALQRLTPNLFTTVALDYDIDVNAPEPRAWLQFLNQLFPDDPESIQLLQEWSGYCLTQDTKQQKMLLIVGPKRSGKGTIGRVLSGLVGQANVAGPTLSNLASNFGLSPLVNKPVAIIADARFSGRSAEQAIVVERLLSISGEDTLTIDRKNREHLTIKLPTRLTILTNELPRLADASAALPSRLLTLQLSRSWYGEEDTTLGDRLLQERAGILRWALEGLKRLQARGRFEQPKSGAETIRRLVELSSPVSAFVEDRCELGGSVAKNTLFTEWRIWCNDCGHEPGNQATFGRNLMAAYPDVQSIRPREGISRLMTYRGISLRRL